MAFGLPIVASEIKPLSEIVVDGRTGLLVPPRDVDRLARAIATLVQDRARASRMGAAGRQRLEERFTVSAMAAATARLYERVIGGEA
jgi:glycosyltransferase involved in cell wall biosynthesis